MGVREECVDPAAGGQRLDDGKIVIFQFFHDLPRCPAFCGIRVQFVVDDENGKLLQVVHAATLPEGNRERSL
ncbi:hypothetical protein ES707_22199 [subsurface metagenome]